ncbi:DUF4942 domain-containing protein [Acetobacterium sp.]|uniref:DUF4942 domain-containing protein n=1 Tax=Acetobacterium sp. TaxID=1872094 RepID=UPI002F41627E
MNEYYPTPEQLINKMFHKIKEVHRDLTILEPSAGKGHICEEVQRLYKMNNRNRTIEVDAIEIEKEYQMILKGKGLSVIHDDFLTFGTYKNYDCIIMNPPFSNGDKHFMRAVDIQERRGGQVVCILNAETIRNPYTNLRRELVSVIDEYHAEVEFITDGFLDAERKTEVEIALISIVFPEIIKMDASLILDKMEKAKDYDDEEDFETSVIQGDPVKGIIESYNYEIKVGVEFLEEYFRIKPVLISGEEIQDKECFIIVKIGNNDRDGFQGNRNELINKFISRTRHKFWKTIFNLKVITEIVTTDAFWDLNSKIEEFSGYDVTRFNIQQLQKELYQNLSTNIESGIESFFDDVTTKAYDGKNTLYYNAMKTNKAWKIGKKAIIWLNAYDSWSHRFEPDYRVTQRVVEMEKILSYLTKGKKVTPDDVIKRVWECVRVTGQTKNIMFEYFNLTFYKKGTCHIEFTNDKAIELLNIFMAKKRNWLPPSYGKKKYYGMTDEEKDAINNFQGKDNYERCRNDDEVQDVLRDRGFLMLEEVSEHE